MEGVNTTGRRKSAVARIYINEGKGQIIVNDRITKIILQLISCVIL